ncbi:MAG: FeoB-associated Cys-rich membrane protein [Treponema sp.]|nr:FeoB-associated Cys-rich membrane protein [Treponema sp.]
MISAGTFLTALILLAITAAAVYSIYRGRKKSKCAGNCASGCSRCFSGDFLNCGTFEDFKTKS